MLQAGRLQIRDSIKSLNFSFYLILPAALGSRVYSASNRTGYQKKKENVSGDQSSAGM
jgi:hypothetical protein